MKVLFSFARSAAFLSALFAMSAEGEENLTFEMALQKIVERTPAVGIEQAKLDSLRGKNLPSHLALLPDLSVNASETFNSNLGPKAEIRGIQADAKLNLLKFGADFYGMKAANRQEEAQTLAVQNAVINAEENGVQAIVDALKTKMTVDVQSRILGIRKDSLKISKARFDRGLLSSQEAGKIQVDADNAEAELRDKEVVAASALAKLGAALGNTNLQMTWPWKSHWEKKGSSLLEATVVALSQRPDWRAAQKNQEAAKYHMDQAWGGIWPTLDLNISYGLYDYRHTFQGNYSGPLWNGGITLTVPLFDHLQNVGAYKSAVAQKHSAELQLLQVQRQAKSDWEAAQRGFEIALQSAKTRDKTLTLSRKLYEDSLRRFRSGYADANQLSVDQQRLYDSELLAIDGWSAVHLNFSKLCHALGHRLNECLETR